MRLLSLILIFCSNVAFGQITNQLQSDSSDIYVHAFNQYCEQVIKYSSDVSTIYIEQGKFYSSLLPDKVRNLDIKKISKEAISRACRNGKHKYITVIIPLRNRNDVFYVGIIPFKVTTNKKGFNFENQGGINFNYSFNKETGEFVFINSNGGIPKIN